MKEVAAASNRNVTNWLEKMENLDLIRGHAQFIGPHSVTVDGDVLEAERIFINVGARADTRLGSSERGSVFHEFEHLGRRLPA
jgi:pyruvate/2-oxoglutarate dehydrogenase complex dihydrolipoamide dehydrogenase (E3) component